MKIKINDVEIHYIDYGKGENTVVLLHGWGQNIAMMKPLGDPLSLSNRVIIVDLPGYGESSEPTYPWTVYDYVEMLHVFLKKIKVEHPILIGHSFGGKISLAYASKYTVFKLVLFGSPYCKEVEHLSLKTKTLKFLKKVPVLNNLEGFAKKHIGSTDYKSASDMMRKILVLTVNLDLTEDVKKISCPTLIVWGTLDSAVPLKRAYELESLITDAAVIELEGRTHYAYLEELERVLRILQNFI